MPQRAVVIARLDLRPVFAVLAVVLVSAVIWSLLDNDAAEDSIEEPTGGPAAVGDPEAEKERLRARIFALEGELQAVTDRLTAARIPPSEDVFESIREIDRIARSRNEERDLRRFGGLEDLDRELSRLQEHEGMLEAALMRLRKRLPRPKTETETEAEPTARVWSHSVATGRLRVSIRVSNPASVVIYPTLEIFAHRCSESLEALGPEISLGTTTLLVESGSGRSQDLEFDDPAPTEDAVPCRFRIEILSQD